MEVKIFFQKKGKRYITKGIHTVLVVIHNKMNHLGFTFTLGMSRAKTWTTRTANLCKKIAQLIRILSYAYVLT